MKIRQIEKGNSPSAIEVRTVKRALAEKAVAMKSVIIDE